jgi:hypothetical protein
MPRGAAVQKASTATNKTTQLPKDARERQPRRNGRDRDTMISPWERAKVQSAVLCRADFSEPQSKCEYETAPNNHLQNGGDEISLHEFVAYEGNCD